MHTVDQLYPCKECNNKFSQFSELMVYLGDKPYTCNECDQTFSQSDKLYNHMNVHTGEKMFCLQGGQSNILPIWQPEESL